MNENLKPNENRVQVDYIIFEGEMARAERHIKRWQFAFVCVCVLALLAMLGMYLEYRKTLDYLAGFDYETESYEYEYTQDGRGINVIGDDNEVTKIGPESESKKDSTETHTEQQPET